MIRLVCALREEAMPLVEKFALRARQPTGMFPVFVNERAMLVVSGVGRHRAAAAVAYLHTLDDERPHAAWLNVGIASHGGLAPGTLALASRVTETASARHWFPPRTVLPEWPGSELICVDSPETVYARNALYDMESAGYCEIAQRCATAELVQVVKVVSDGPQHPIANVTSATIAALIEDNAARIEQIALQLDATAATLQQLREPHPELARATQACRFSVTQRHQLAQLLSRWRVLAPHQPILERALAGAPSGERVLAVLQRELDALPVDLQA